MENVAVEPLLYPDFLIGLWFMIRYKLYKGVWFFDKYNRENEIKLGIQNMFSWVGGGGVNLGCEMCKLEQ